ncbi:MAG TPA: HAMP domain-containing sensor histidine kinase [Acidimicrobiia bacterium]
MRSRLRLVSLAVTAMVVMAFLLPLAALVRELARDRALTRAERDAQLVALLITSDPASGPALALDTFGGAEAGLSIVLDDGSVLGAPLDPELTSDLNTTAAFRRGEPGGEAVYVPAIAGDGEIATVRLFVADAELSSNVVRAWLVLGGLGVILVLIGVAAADRLGRSVVRSVDDLSAAANRLGEGDLEARVDPSGPQELVDVGNEFNRLAASVAGLLQQERETAADLSHRLRTPLMAARLDAEALPGSPARDRLLGDIDELARSVDHIIGEARRTVRQGGAHPVDVAAIARRSMAFWSALGDEQDRKSDLVVSLPEPVLVTAPAADLEAAIDALLGNVFAHTPEGTGYSLLVEPESDGWIRVTVADTGPGFSVADPLERGASGAGSTGLGLDIARRTAEAAGGRIRLETLAEGGASISMSLRTTDEAPPD